LMIAQRGKNSSGKLSYHSIVPICESIVFFNKKKYFLIFNVRLLAAD
jgi:hypothetical protein